MKPLKRTSDLDSTSKNTLNKKHFFYMTLKLKNSAIIAIASQGPGQEVMK